MRTSGSGRGSFTRLAWASLSTKARMPVKKMVPADWAPQVCSGRYLSLKTPAQRVMICELLDRLGSPNLN